MDFLGANFLKNIRFFIFGKFLTHQQKKKEKSGNYAIFEYAISRHIFRCTFRIYIVLYGYKLFLTSYVELKIRKYVKFQKFLQKFEDLRTSTLALVEHSSLFTYFRFFKVLQKLFILICDMFIVVVKYMKYCKWTSFQLEQPQSVGKLNHKKSLLNILPKLISFYNSESKVTNTE